MKLAEIIKTVTVNEIIGDAEREITDIQINHRGCGTGNHGYPN